MTGKKNLQICLVFCPPHNTKQHPRVGGTLNMALHPGIPPQKERINFGLDSPISEDSNSPFSKRKKLKFCGMMKTAFTQ